MGAIRAWAGTEDGKHAGDPAKAAKAIMEAVAAGVPTFRLPLGADAVKSIREKLAQVGADVDRTEAVAAGTRFD